MLFYRRYLTAPSLQPFIQGYWDIRTGNAPQVLDLVSDGHPELVFLQQPGVELDIGSRGRQPVPLAGFIGQVSERSFTWIPMNSRIIYVKLYPWTPYLLFQVPLGQLANSTASLEALSCGTEYRQLARDIRSMPHTPEIVERLNAFFLNQTAGIRNDNSFITYAIREIFRANGALHIKTLTRNIHASNRYVEKVFKKYIGLAPKQYARLIRVKKASLMLLDKNRIASIGQIAAELNYYDPSHFLKDFRAVAGRAPTEFLREQGNLPLDKVEVYLRQWDFS